jgi:uncharacterized protein
MMDESSARELLITFKVPAKVVEHSEVVHETCMNLVELLKDRKPYLKVNKRLVSLGSLLHDIGRSKTHDISHGLAGAEIIRGLNVKNSAELEKIALICERHVGAGISKEEAEKMGLPLKDYIPRTIEEKVIAYCDNTCDGSVARDPNYAALKFEKAFGKQSDISKRVRDLNRFFEGLIGV